MRSLDSILTLRFFCYKIVITLYCEILTRKSSKYLSCCFKSYCTLFKNNVSSKIKKSAWEICILLFEKSSTFKSSVYKSEGKGVEEAAENRNYLARRMTDEINEIIRVLQLTNYDEDEWDADNLTVMKKAQVCSIFCLFSYFIFNVLLLLKFFFIQIECHWQ